MKNKHKVFVILTILIFFVSCKGTSIENKSDEKGETPVFDPKMFSNVASLQEQLHLIAKNETPSVVSISTEKLVSSSDNYDFYGPFDPFDFFFRDDRRNRDDDQNKRKKEYRQGGLGSGVVYKQKGNKYYVLTNNHVIENVDKIKITIDQNKSYDAKLLGTDPDVDIAVVEITTKDELRVAKFGDSDKLNTGDFVIAIGNPYGLQGTMTFGIISALGRSDLNTGKVNLTNFIQTDAAINPGNSGGPLLDINGEVIGINTLIYTQSGGSIGLGFAIPVNVAKKVAEQIIEKGKVEHGWLGVYFEQLNEEKIKTLNLKQIKNGMLVTEVLQDSPAEKAGIISGDVLLELNGVKLVNSSDLVIAIGNSTPGTKVKLKIFRDNKILDKEVTLGDRKDFVASSKTEKETESQIMEDYGFRLADINDSLRSKYKIDKNVTGVVVTDISTGSLAGRAGVKEGDVIFKINSDLVKTVNDFKKILKDKEGRNYFFINRNGREFIVIM
ncbi:MAG: Do family serine endopeptidase [Spirochaetes bacterium]|nr:Do family serine endopeptidase [Spirochaetota bacterium]